MDEQVKARLIGATILVAIAVALVPELLSGPKPDDAGATGGEGKRGTRTYTIDLGGAVASGARAQPGTPVADAPVREAPRLPTVAAPGPAAEQVPDSFESAPAETPAMTTATPAAAARPPAPVAAPAATPAATVASTRPVPVEVRPTAPAKGGWSVQVGAFGTAATARKLVSDLGKDGLAAYVAPLERNGKTLHRVRVGPAPTRAEADKVAARLKAKGLPASVVTGD